MKVLVAFAIAAVSVLFAAFGGYVLGAKIEQTKSARALNEAQATLWFNHLLQFREIETDLAKGCSGAALEAAQIAIDQEMGLLAGFHRDHEGPSLANKYISDRDPQLLSQLESFKRKYGVYIPTPQCGK
jgi:hypothetical protein